MALAISVIVPMIGWECLDALSDDEVNAVLDSSPSALDGPSGLSTHQTAVQGIDSSIDVGRMIEQSGRSALMNLHGLGMTRLVVVSGFRLRSGKTKPSPLSTGGASPALSFQISKWATSVPPMLVTIRSASRLLHL